MSLSTGSEVLWSDIKAIYTSVNTQRKRWSYATITVPSNPGKCVPSHVSTLITAIEDLKSTSAGSRADVSGSAPRTGDLLDEGIFNNMRTTLTNLAAINISFNSSFRSANFSGNHGFDSCSCNGFYSRSDYRSGFGGSTDFF